MWLTDIKIAIIEKDSDRLDKLLEEMPNFETNEDIQEAMYLLREAAGLIYELQDKTSLSMKKMKKHMDFVNSTQAPAYSKLDIKS